MRFFRSREQGLAVVFVVSIFGVMTLVRLAHVLTTGFMVADEGLYMYSAIFSAERGSIVISYPTRLLYNLILAVSGIIFNLDKVYKAQKFLSGFNLFWTTLSVLGFYKVSELCFPENRNSHIFILLLPTLTMMAVANVAYLTESMALAFVIFGVYFMCRLIESPGMKRYAVGGLFIGLAFLVREPYGLVSVGAIGYMIYLSARRRIPPKTALLFIVLVLLCFRLPADGSSVSLSKSVFLEVTKQIASIMETIGKFQIDLSPLETAPTDIHSGGYAPEQLEPYEQKPLDIQVWGAQGEALRYDRLFQWNRLYYGTVYTVAGIFLGTNPLVFFIMLYGFAKLVMNWRSLTQSQKTVGIFSVLAVFTVAGSGYLTGPPTEVVKAVGLAYPWGTMARLSHTGLFSAILIVPALSERKFTLDRKHTGTVIVGLLLFASFGRFVIFTFERQFNQGYVPLMNFQYRAPYVKVYDYVEDSGKTLLFGGPNVVLISLFTRMRPNVFVALYPRDEATFLHLLAADEWDTVLIYGTTHHTVDPAVEELFPFAWDLLAGRTDYGCDVIWDDRESYFYKLEGGKP